MGVASNKPKNYKRMKAVSLIFEFALLFMFGIVIFVSSVSVFQNYQGYFNSVGVNDQLTEVSEYISTNIIKLSEMGNGEDSSITIKIPKKIGVEGGNIGANPGEDYLMELSNQGLKVTALKSNITKSTGIYNITKSMQLSGSALSGAGGVIIYKTGNQIILS